MAPQSFLVQRSGDVAYVAFSGVQLIGGLDPSCREMVPLVSVCAGDGVFSGLHRELVDGENPPMVLSCLLDLFLSVYQTPRFQTQMSEVLANSKSVVFTGHSIGGSIASLSALSLLSHFHSISSPFSVMCISFGSPMLGNESFSKAILQQRWGGNFLHVAAKHDIIPRLLFTPTSAPILPHMHALFNLLHLSMRSPMFPNPLAIMFPEEKKAELLQIVQHSLLALSQSVEKLGSDSFWPFGSYIFCTNAGSVCLDNPMAVVKLLYLMLAEASPDSCVEDHLNYESYVTKISWQILDRGNLVEANLCESSYEAGVALALEASQITQSEGVVGGARNCLRMAKQMGQTRNLKCANLAIDLAKINPLRAQIEWYKATCDASDDQLGYYDAFKLRGASKKHFKVNMNRIKLGRFWNNVVDMLETNQLPYDFHNRLKWVNASQFYKLLVEPLDIAEYYRQRKHLEKGHYLEHGRERRYILFDKWWKGRKLEEESSNMRRNYASLTQDSCFWARLEEARDGLSRIRSERDPRKQSSIRQNITAFDQYARKMIEQREVSKDVLAKNSSYNLFVEEWKELKPQLDQWKPHFPGFFDGEGNNSCRGLYSRKVK